MGRAGQGVPRSPVEAILRGPEMSPLAVHTHTAMSVSIPAMVGERRPEIIWEMLPRTEGSQRVSINIKMAGSVLNSRVLFVSS